MNKTAFQMDGTDIKMNKTDFKMKGNVRMNKTKVRN